MRSTRRELVRVVNAEDGSESWVEVKPAVAELLSRPEPKLRERLLRRDQSLERIADAKVRVWGGPGNSWEGPRLAFRLLLGTSDVWSGPESLWLWDDASGAWVCRFCSHLSELPASAYCVACDRSGLDRVVGKPSGADLAKRTDRGRVYAPTPGVKGGRD
jgi:hypothetical protein